MLKRRKGESVEDFAIRRDSMYKAKDANKVLEVGQKRVWFNEPKTPFIIKSISKYFPDDSRDYVIYNYCHDEKI